MKPEGVLGESFECVSDPSGGPYMNGAFFTNFMRASQGSGACVFLRIIGLGMYCVCVWLLVGAFQGGLYGS